MWGTVPKLAYRGFDVDEYDLVRQKVTLKQRYYEGGRELGIVNYLKFARRTGIKLKVNEVAEISKPTAKKILKEKW
jgi:hypothetical protein